MSTPEPAAGVAALPPAVAAEFAPMLRRAVALDPRGLARVRSSGPSAQLLLRLPFGALVGRTVHVGEPARSVDVTVAAAELLDWIDGARPEPPPARDELWRGATPPEHGWRRVDTVPDTVVRELVRSGALALTGGAARDGVPGAQPRAEVTDALLDAVVLTVTADDGTAHAEITLRTLSALTRMGFLPRDTPAAVDVAGRWTRLAARYGSVFAGRVGLAVFTP